MRNKLLLVLLSVLMLVPGWLGLNGLLLLGALVPLLYISGSAGSTRREAWQVLGWCAVTFGFWSGITTWWVWYAAPAGAILSVIITAGLMGGVTMVYHYASKRASKAVAYTLLIAGWIAAEYAYTVGEISFPWLTLGNGFADSIWMIQWYDTTGVFGGSLWVLLCNIFIYEGFILIHKKIRILALLVAIVPVLISVIKYHTYKSPLVTATVSVVQPNIEPYNEKYDLSYQEQNAILTELMRRSPADVDYIVTPETALREPILVDELEFSKSLDLFAQLAAQEFPHSQMILGASTTRYYFNGNDRSPTARAYQPGLWYDHYNSVIALDSTRHAQLRHKSLLVLGAEKIPYYSIFKNMEFLVLDLGGITGQLGVDTEQRVFRSSQGRVSGGAVCWEGVFGEYMGGFVKRGAQILFIISNDGWWGDTPGYRQLFAFSRLRAVELRRSIGRSANTGISGLIDDRGCVVGKLGWEKRGTISGKLPLNGKITFYARYGDYIARIASYTFILTILYLLAYLFRRKNHLVK